MPLERIDATYLTMICDAFMELEDILSDGEVGALLVGSGLEDVYPHSAKHSRLLSAFKNQQNIDNGADTIAVFLRRTGEHLKRRFGDHAFKRYQEKINEVLSYAGYQLNANCYVQSFDANKPIYSHKDAEERAENLNRAIKTRHLHPDILLCSRPEFILDKGYFRSVQEAVKVLQEKIKAKANLRMEGPTIAEHALAFSSDRRPQLLLNNFASEADYAEQFTLMCMLKAIFLMFQDEQTKAFRKPWHISFEDALDLLSLISMFHRKVDESKHSS